MLTPFLKHGTYYVCLSQEREHRRELKKKAPKLKQMKLLLRCRLYLVKRSVTSSFHGPLQSREQEKVTGGQIWGILWLRHH
ncbi:hypothetical protein LAZ67_1000485 [Cordylochernes scorpioides]|uniref:Uncharacterized protein n=1 Tax=Cordylochernes scorpioides TaxID=51811 RepID=A0ABY6JXV2_9ARAC|nr:hypothetical protein LAZ67_1000485 [Cordylochernes scorpioides]